ncbi:MAG: T9SS type A sorting domain-containing protein [Bacteroidetes bacterium]|nr:MAG: T9SS type A sorting domain-containing protein [Bacteroidota bacterium]
MTRLALIVPLLLAVAVPTAKGQPWQFKCTPAVRFADRAAVAPENYYLVVTDLSAFAGRLATLGTGTLLGQYAPSNIAVVRISPAALQEQVLPLPEVLFADSGAEEPHVELPVPGHNLFANRITALHARYAGWNGTGRTVSIKENAFDTLDVDVRGRVGPTDLAAAQTSVHATIMASLLAGCGTSGLAGWGVSWGARVVPADFSILLPEPPGVYQKMGVTVQNHSYGVGIENYYGADAMAYDRSVALQPDLVHVFSAGNLGGQEAGMGSYQGLPGFANLSGSFKMAKNVILVGATDSFLQVIPQSSRGPAYDGRVKPDLVAFGQDGTSGAAALVSGTAAVLQQGFTQTHNGVLPPAALIRALLVNGASDIGMPGPDYLSGFGSLNAKRSAGILDAGNYWVDSVASLETRVFQIFVPSGQQQLKVCLAWTDPAAAPNAAKALVQDLDLSLTGPDGTTLDPLVLSVEPSSDALILPAQPGRDSINNIEQIFWPDPQPGVYQVAVTGRRVLDNFQAFALVYSSTPSDTLIWSAPVKGDPLQSGETAILYWESTLGSPQATLQYRLIGQASWQDITGQLSLPEGYYRWQTPDISALLQFRILAADGRAFTGDTVFVGQDLRLELGFNCSDSVLLFWKSAGQGIDYQVWGLGEQYLEPLFVTTDTAVLLEKAVFPQERFAVSVLPGPGWVGNRSPAPDIRLQGVGCYFRNFLAQFTNPAEVHLQTSLGTTHGLALLSFEKWQSGGFIPLVTYTPPFTGLSFHEVDPDPAPGVNRYRVRLSLTNGGEVFSEVVEVYYAGTSGVVVYPNPASSGAALQVIYQEQPEDLFFEMYDGLGRFILEKRLEDQPTEIYLPTLSTGMYYFTVRKPDKRVVQRGKLLLRG